MTDKALRDRLAKMARAQRVLYSRRVLEAGLSTRDLPVLPLAQGDISVPLTRAQKAIAAMEALGRSPLINHVSVALALNGPVQADVMRAAYADLVARHEALTMGFEGTPITAQRAGVGAPSWALVDLSAEPDREAALSAYRKQFETAPFDLGRGDVARASLVRLGPEAHVLCLSAHHLGADTWALGLLGRDLAFAYRARLLGDAPDWPAPATRLRDVAIWEDEVGEARQTPASFDADGLDAVLPPDYRRAAVPKARIARRRVEPLTCPERLAATCIAASMRALSRASGVDHLAIAVAYAGREHADMHHLVAPCVEARRLDLDLSVHAGDAALVEAVTNKLAALSQDSAVRTVGSGVMVVVQNAVGAGLDLPGVTARRLPTQTAGLSYDLTVVFHPDGAGTDLEIEYRADLYDAATIAVFADRLVDTLTQLSGGTVKDADVGLSISETPAGPTGASLAERFAHWAQTTPDAPALLCNGQAVSYAALYGDACAVASGIAQSCPLNSFVIIALDGAQAVRAAIACALAGCGFVMADPALTADQLADLRRDVEATLVIGTGGVTLEALAHAPHTHLRTPEYAYIAFTSGSTKQRKGVLQSWRAFAQFLSWQERYFCIGQQDRIALWSALEFDASLTELFGALWSGACLCVPDPVRRLDPTYVAKWIAQDEVTYFLTVPSFVHRAVSVWEAWGTGPVTLKKIALSGEVLSPELVARMRACMPHASVINLFGPTECVLAAAYRLPETEEPHRLPAVGHAVEGRALSLRDAEGQLVRPGEAGEIWIASDYLTDGYWNNPDDTARHFCELEGTRAFRTGDLARMRADGALQFLGRMDSAIKVRGARVDLDEIEAALLALNAVSAAAVAARPLEADVQLVAAVVMADDAPAADAPRLMTGAEVLDIREQLAQALRPTAIPSAFVSMPGLPRTPTGKIDRRAISTIDPAALSRKGADRVEDRVSLPGITDAWRDVLGHVPALDANFFDVGGTSLLAVDLHRALEGHFPGRLKLLDLYLAPSIDAQNALLSRNGRGATVQNTARTRTRTDLAARRKIIKRGSDT